MAPARWLDEQEARLWRAHLGLGRELQRAFERQLERDAGLTAAEYAVLVPLSEAPEGLLRMRELGRIAGWDRSRLSHQVRRMEKRGLVAREECEEDARGAMVRLTGQGRAAIEAAAPEHVETVRRYFFDLLSEPERRTLAVIYERLLERLARDAG
ncbi:MarR family transcriptional regulator [Amycolatopsis cynarae]|uniref:MarR family transcriptional regulator n=1 Tax=Amycolatopsis cynarae TaxID=2995223 RepID=A0ABY7AU71_9PSEU|nr:MarR family transcriptional regulator [Amycolatopsis sp. HUAS 11-8]WAL63260.1 MarR family transcriptional regulator [Amycolatopsis sp. HUAS 11-8]